MPEAHQVILLADGQGVVRMASRAAAELLGSDPRDLEGLRLADLLDAPGPAVLEAVFQSLRGDEAGEGTSPGTRLAVRLRLSEGRLAEGDLRLVRIARGSAASGSLPAGAILMTIELLDRASREPAAGEPNDGHRARLPEAVRAAAASDAVLICRGGVVEEPGEAIAEMIGLEAKELAGWRVKGLVASEDLLPVVEILRAVESGQHPSADFGFRLLRAAGKPPIEVAARARRVHHRGAPAVLLGLEDISESLNAARRAAESLTRLDAALAATNDAVLILGLPEAGSPIILASRTLETLFGIDAAPWMGRPFWDLWKHLRPLHAFPDEEEGRLKALLQHPATVSVQTVSLSLPRGRVFERSLGPVRDRDGRITGQICSFRDVTERTEAEEQLRRSVEEARAARVELEQLHEELRLANEGLERRMSEMQRLNRDLKILDEMKSNLLANVSHELQTPLVSIKGFTEMILKGRLGDVTPEQQRGLQVALRNINRLIGLIDNLLAFARAQELSTPLKLEVFQLGPLVEEAVELVREKAQARGVTIRVEAPQGDLFIRADRDKILQVLLNLLTNAIKYNRENGQVVVESERGRKGTARVEVRDTGIGIPRDELDRIFDRYFQAGNVSGPREGTGIGLSITKNILRQHGCMIRADSEEGKGSVFSFTLPLDRKSRHDKPVFRSAGPSGQGGAAPAPPEAPGLPDPGDPPERVVETSREES